MGLKEKILAALTQTAEGVEEVAFETELEQLKKDDTESYLVVCDAVRILTSKLQGKVRSKFLAAMLEGLGVAVTESQDQAPAEKGPIPPETSAP